MPFIVKNKRKFFNLSVLVTDRLQTVDSMKYFRCTETKNIYAEAIMISFLSLWIKVKDAEGWRESELHSWSILQSSCWWICRKNKLEDMPGQQELVKENWMLLWTLLKQNVQKKFTFENSTRVKQAKGAVSLDKQCEIEQETVKSMVTFELNEYHGETNTKSHLITNECSYSIINGNWSWKWLKWEKWN